MLKIGQLLMQMLSKPLNGVKDNRITVFMSPVSPVFHSII